MNVDEEINEKHEQIVEKTEQEIETVINKEENTNTNTDSDWHKTPISLKGLKKQLNEIFSVK